MIRIEFQHFEGCPNSPQMLDNVKRAIIGLENQIIFNVILVEKDEDAKEYHFRGSPTLLINNEDYEGLLAPEEPKLACRIYPMGLPSPKDIRDKILKHLAIDE